VLGATNKLITLVANYGGSNMQFQVIAGEVLNKAQNPVLINSG
jgi:hypothetical protein